MTGRGTRLRKMGPLCPISPKIGALKFDYSGFDDAPAIMDPRHFSFLHICEFFPRYRRTTSEEELARLYHIPIPSQTDLPISYNIAPSLDHSLQCANAIAFARRHPVGINPLLGEGP